MKLVHVEVGELPPAPSIASMDYTHLEPIKSYPAVKTTYFCGGAHGSRTQDRPRSTTHPGSATCPWCLAKLAIHETRKKVEEVLKDPNRQQQAFFGLDVVFSEQVPEGQVLLMNGNQVAIRPEDKDMFLRQTSEALRDSFASGVVAGILERQEKA